MSENHEQRLSDVEREQVRQGERLSRIETDVGKIGAGVDKLLERPKGLSWGAVGGTIVATAGGLLSVAAVGWWLIGSSPAHACKASAPLAAGITLYPAATRIRCVSLRTASSSSTRRIVSLPRAGLRSGDAGIALRIIVSRGRKISNFAPRPGWLCTQM